MQQFFSWSSLFLVTFFLTSECDRCQFSLGNDTLLLKQTFARYWNETSHVGKLEDEDRQLQGVQGELNATLAKLGASEQTLDVLSGMVRNMTALQPTYNKTLTDLSVGVNISNFL